MEQVFVGNANVIIVNITKTHTAKDYFYYDIRRS